MLQWPIRKSRLQTGLAVSLVVHGLFACLTLGSYTPPQVQDRQRGSTTISLQCIAMQRESETATEAALLSATSVLQDHRPLLTPPLADPTHDPQPRQPTEMAATHRDIEAEFPAVSPQAFFEMARREAQEPETVPTEWAASPKLPRHPLQEETPVVTKTEIILTESRQTIVSQQSSGVEVPPTFAARIDPIYPPDLLLSGAEGSVHLLVRVGLDGKPVSVSVFRSSGYQQMDRSALDAVLGWKFSPARIGPTPIAKTVIVPVNFRIER